MKKETKPKEFAIKEVAALGGKKTLQLYGISHFSEIGKKGAEARRLKRSGRSAKGQK